MSFKVALAGNPNCGKTTLYNELTGSSQYVGNWPGVTVEKKEGRLKGSKDVVIVDLPGIYSLSPYTPEEIVSRNFIIKEKPDLIINIIDATNLERNLYLTLQLLECGIPVVVALNMIDVIQKNGETIDADKLSQKLGCPVIATSAVKGNGLKQLSDRIISLIATPLGPAKPVYYNADFENTISKIEDFIKDVVKENIRWYALKLFEKDKLVNKELQFDFSLQLKIYNLIKDYEIKFDDDCDSIITDLRYKYIADMLNGVYIKKQKHNTVSDKIDRVITNRFLALPIFFFIMWGIYFISIQTIGSLTIGWMETLFNDFIGSNVSDWLVRINTAEWFRGFVVDGIINGVGSVLVFVPQLMILFLCLSLLEDLGYMSRVAFIMDRIFRNFGLSGKSFIPMIIGTGCTVPGIMASRTIANERDRKMTIMLTPFIPCGAKLPVFALIAGAVFPNSSIVAPSMYFAGIIMVIICGVILKQTKMFKGESAPFVMELPQYRLPKLKSLFIHMWDRSKDFIIKAGTIIFAASGIIWLLVSFNWSFEMVDTQFSMLASIGNFIAPVFKPLGFGNWQTAIATLTGYVAKENVVATFGIIFGLGSDVATNDPSLANQISVLFENPAAAYAFMIFTLFAPPCFAAIGAIKREMNSVKWTLFTISFQIFVSFFAAFLVFQIGSMIFYNGSPLSTIILAAIVFSLIIYIIYKRIKNKNKCSGCTGCCSNCKR